MTGGSPKTIVYQSFRTVNIPDWITTCMRSVKNWAELQGYDYELIDDRFLNLVPDWYRDKANNDIYLITDLARLVKAKEYLNSEYQRTIWVDIDMIIVNPDQFKIEITNGFSFCDENWINLNYKNEVILKKNVNNSFMVFNRGNTFLDYYIECCCNIVKSSDNLKKTSVGTEFLTKLYQVCPFTLLTDVGLFSPYFILIFLKNKKMSEEILKKYFPKNLCAVNLCHSFRNKVRHGHKMEDHLYEATITKLRKTVKL